MSLHDAAGNKLYRRVEVRIVYPENVLKTENIVRKAPAGKGIGEEGVNELLMQIADRLETLYPWWEFEPIELASQQSRVSKHVFSFKGYATKSTTTKESNTPETEAGIIAMNTNQKVTASEPGLIVSPLDPRAEAAS